MSWNVDREYFVYILLPNKKISETLTGFVNTFDNSKA